MKKLNLKIVSSTLLLTMLLSSTSCKLQKKDNKFASENYSIVINLDDEKFSNIEDNHVKEIIKDLVEKIEAKGYDLPIDNFIDKLSKTIFIKNAKDEFALGSYNDEEHKFTYIPNDDETIRHELLHMILPSHNNACIDEGLVQIFLNDLFGYEITENVYDASLCKIFCRLLDSEELKKFVLGDTEVLKNKLSSIKPAYDDANQFLIYANNGEYYYRLYQESIFNDNKENFRNSQEFGWLKEYRKIVKERIKIYLYSYYDNMDFNEEPYDRLVEIFEVLNLVTYFMDNSFFEDKVEKDYFLEPIVDKICSLYNVDKETLVSADEKAKDLLNFKYLDKLKNVDEKVR